MPIQYQPFPEFQVPNVNLLGALAQGEALRNQQLTEQKTQQTMDLAALKYAQEAEAARIKQQADELDFAVKNANIFRDRVQQINEKAPDAQARYEALLQEFQPKAPSILGGAPKLFNSETKQALITSHDDFMKLTAPKERDTVVDGQVGKATLNFDPTTPSDPMVSGLSSSG